MGEARDLELLAGSTPSVTYVAAMTREGPALQAGSSIGRDRAQSVCSGNIQGGQREVAWVGGALLTGLCIILNSKWLALWDWYVM